MDNLEKLLLNGPLISAQLYSEIESLPVSVEMMAVCEEMACNVIALAMVKGDGSDEMV